MTIDAPIVVTGAAGWLGSQLVKHLVVNDAQRLRALILPGQDGDALRALSSRVEVLSGDIRDSGDCEALCEGMQGGVAFHTAGVIHPSRVKDFFNINVQGTRNLLEAASAAGLRRIVALSSNSPCGCNPHPDHLFDEEASYHPYMSYGRSKMMMEQAVHEYQRSGQIETVIVRAPWFYGPGQPPRQTLFFTMVRQGKGPIVGPGTNLRSMAYTENTAEGLRLAGFHPSASGQVYWIADERPYSMNEILDTIESLLEKEFNLPVAHRRLRLPGLASELALAVDWAVQSVGLYHQKLHVLSEMNKTIACTVEKARQELGYAPRIALEEGMRRSIAWCLKNGHRI